MARNRNGISGVEQHVMLALLRLHPNGYGISVRDELESRTGEKWSLGSIYATFDRLEEQGYVKPREGEATPERGGRRKTYFELTGLGQKALYASLAALDALRGYSGLKTILSRLIWGVDYVR